MFINLEVSQTYILIIHCCKDGSKQAGKMFVKQPLVFGNDVWESGVKPFFTWTVKLLFLKFFNWVYWIEGVYKKNHVGVCQGEDKGIPFIEEEYICDSIYSLS